LKSILNAAKRQLLLIAGPTASGKTALALHLARSLPLRLISADSMQVYRGMDIGTAKPALGQRERFALIDVVDPGEAYSAGRFARDAAVACENAWSSGQVPCLCGGSGLYLRALITGMADLPAISPELRAEIGAMPPEERRSELSRLDPQTASVTDLKNPRRVSRALEVLRATGKGLSAWQRESPGKPLNAQESLGFCLSPSQETLELRIQRRNREALSGGWLDEVRHLAEKYGPEALRSTGAIGYSELLDVAAGKLSLAEAAMLIERRTLQYARRQKTWFRRERALTWSDDILEIETACRHFLMR
jgi:tRNA dimethylallyltransferase